MKSVSVFVCAFVFGVAAQAAPLCIAGPGVVCEQPVASDAGQYISTALYPDGVGPLNSIYGEVNGRGGADMYAISIQNTSAFSASYTPSSFTLASGANTLADSQAGLYLFNADGTGVEAGDGTTGLAGFSGAAGTYFIMITGDGNAPEYNAGGMNSAIFAPFVAGQESLPVGGAGALSAYSGGGCGTNCAGGYEINLTGAGYSAVPEPASIALTGGLMSVLGLMFRMKRK